MSTASSESIIPCSFCNHFPKTYIRNDCDRYGDALTFIVCDNCDVNWIDINLRIAITEWNLMMRTLG